MLCLKTNTQTCLKIELMLPSGLGVLDDPSLVTRRLAPCKMVLCASPEYLKKHGTPETPEDISRAPRLAFSQAVSAGDWTIYDPEGSLHRIESACRITSNNIQLLLESALAGTGIIYGPSFVFCEHIKKDRLIELLPAYKKRNLPFRQCIPVRSAFLFKVRSFVDFIAEALRDTQL